MWTKPGDEGSVGIHTSRGGKEVQTLSGNTIYRRKVSFVFDFMSGGERFKYYRVRVKGTQYPCRLALADICHFLWEPMEPTRISSRDPVELTGSDWIL